MNDFTKKVYEIVGKVPHGRVATYKDIARAVGHPAASRAVGNSLNKNRLVKVPCHRVVRSDGKIGGFIRGSREKMRILRKEGVEITGQRVDKNFMFSL